MAQAHREEKNQENPKMEIKERHSEPFKFNVQAPEFIPRSQTQMPLSGYFYPCFHILGGTASPDWFYVGDAETPAYLISNPNINLPNCSSKTVISDDFHQKVIKQVEYLFSDMSLFANETLAKHISKDPEGYVSISVIASTKKVKSLVSNTLELVQALRLSSKLVVSDDGKKVKRKHAFTEKDREELQATHAWILYKLRIKNVFLNENSVTLIAFIVLQSRTVVAENFPEDHSHHNLEKIFSVIGSVKTIRVCHPQESNSSRPKGNFFFSNKLHALVEYPTTEMAERAVEKLNDERNWRKGLRVRLLLRRSPKSVLKIRKLEFDGLLDDDESPTCEFAEDALHPGNTDYITDCNTEENSMGAKKGWARGHGKGRVRTPNHCGRGLLASSPQLSCITQCEASARQSSKGPRMPDGTRGFTMGRGKASNNSTPISTP